LNHALSLAMMVMVISRSGFVSFSTFFTSHLKLKFNVQNHFLKKQIEYCRIMYGNIMVQLHAKNDAMHAPKYFILIVMGRNGFFGYL
jgi:hypothetical protein